MAVSLLSSLYVKEALEKSMGSQDTQHSNLTPPYPSQGDKNRGLEEKIVCPNTEINQLLEEKRKAEGELKDLKAQLEEAGFSSVSHIRNTLLSVYLENVELKEQMGEAMSEARKRKEDKEKEENWLVEEARSVLKEDNQCAEVKKAHRKLQNANTMISLLREQLALNSKEGGKNLNAQLIISLTKEIDRLKTEVVWTPRDPSALAEQLQDRVCKGLYSRPQIIDLVSILDLKHKEDHQVNSQGLLSSNVSLEQSSLQGLTHYLRSQLELYEQGCQDLREKLLVSEATVKIQASQLEQYQALFHSTHHSNKNAAASSKPSSATASHGTKKKCSSIPTIMTSSQKPRKDTSQVDAHGHVWDHSLLKGESRTSKINPCPRTSSSSTCSNLLSSIWLQ